MGNKRKSHISQFKAKVALAAIQNEETAAHCLIRFDGEQFTLRRFGSWLDLGFGKARVGEQGTQERRNGDESVPGLQCESGDALAGVNTWARLDLDLYVWSGRLQVLCQSDLIAQPCFCHRWPRIQTRYEGLGSWCAIPGLVGAGTKSPSKWTGPGFHFHQVIRVLLIRAPTSR